MSIRPSPLASGMIACCGLFLLLNGFLFSFLVRDQGMYDLVMGLLFISSPGVVFGSLIFIQGWLRFRTSLSFDQDGLRMVIPAIRGGGCFFPLRKRQMRWGDIQRVTSAKCLYFIFALPFSVRQYTLYTAQGRYTLAPAFCPRLEELIGVIAERAGVSVEDVGEEQRSFFQRSPDL